MIVKVPDTAIINADATGVFEPVSLIEAAYRDSMKLKGCEKEPGYPKFTFDKRRWEEAILKRRSIREFSKKAVSAAQFETIMNHLTQPVPSDCDEPVQIYAVINRVEGMQSGIRHEGGFVKVGDFSERAGYLCLEQRLGSDSAVTIFLLSNGCNYRALYQKAGVIGHRAYLVSEYLGLGCSGIGAYYDDDVNRFLEAKGMVLYALAIGA